MITTTLNRIRDQHPCAEGWATLLQHLGKTRADDEPLPLSTIVKSNGLGDALWCCHILHEHDSLWRHFAVDCAETLPQSPITLETLAVARRFANGEASRGELQGAYEKINKFIFMLDSFATDAESCMHAARWCVCSNAFSGMQWSLIHSADQSATERFIELVDRGFWTPKGTA